jgi:hypothetical protein
MNRQLQIDDDQIDDYLISHRITGLVRSRGRDDRTSDRGRHPFGLALPDRLKDNTVVP